MAKISLLDPIGPSVAGLLLPGAAGADTVRIPIETLRGRHHVPLKQTNVSGNYWILEPEDGFSVPAGEENRALFSFVVQHAHVGGGIVIQGAGFLGAGDPRQMSRPDMVDVVPNILLPGTRVLFGWRQSLGRFIIESPSAGPPVYVVDCIFADGSTSNLWLLHPLQTLPNNTGERVKFRVHNPPAQQEGGLVCKVIGVNGGAGEEVQVRGPSGDVADQIAPGAYLPTDVVEITRHANGSFVITSIRRPSLDVIGAEPPPPTGSFSLFALRTSAASRALSAYGH